MRSRNKENAGTPARWRTVHGAWYYRVPPGQEAQWDNKKQFRLGGDLNEAYATWSKRLGSTQQIMTIGQLLERYYREVSSQKAPQTYRGDGRHMKALLVVFKDVGLSDLTPQDIYKYIDKRDAKIAARREKSMLSHAYTKAVEWGYVNSHPFKGEVRLKGEKPRTRYVEDWEVQEVYAMKPKRKKGDPLVVIQAYLELKYLSGLRQSDLLRLPEYRGKVGDYLRISIHKRPGDSPKLIDLEVTAAMHQALTGCMAVRPRDIAPWLFCTRRGEPYFDETTGEASGWHSNWQRFMDRVVGNEKHKIVAETSIKERFTEHDIRAKAGSDAESKERAQELLTHDSVATTMRAYRRKAEKVRPLR